jgi:hypothetical protein
MPFTQVRLQQSVAPAQLPPGATHLPSVLVHVLELVSQLPEQQGVPAVHDVPVAPQVGVPLPPALASPPLELPPVSVEPPQLKPIAVIATNNHPCFAISRFLRSGEIAYMAPGELPRRCKRRATRTTCRLIFSIGQKRGLSGMRGAWCGRSSCHSVSAPFGAHVGSMAGRLHR